MIRRSPACWSSRAPSMAPTGWRTQLEQSGVAADAIHGNKSQGGRQRALERFRRGEARVLVATDIAARGIDVDDISHVINYELPDTPESYVHRIGRTARAGADGIAYSFCDVGERNSLGQIERLIRQELTVVGDGPAPAPPPAQRPARRYGNGPRHRRLGRVKPQPVLA